MGKLIFKKKFKNHNVNFYSSKCCSLQNDAYSADTYYYLVDPDDEHHDKLHDEMDKRNKLKLEKYDSGVTTFITAFFGVFINSKCLLLKKIEIKYFD